MRPIVSRIFRVLAVACGTAIVAAIVLAILDLYLTGHGFASLPDR